jgi:F-type H+-transporting ATPase subunit alpha
MKQKQYQPLSVAEMAISLFAANEGFIDDVEVDKVGSFEAALLSNMKSNHADLMAKINDTGDFNDDIAGQMRTAIESFKKTGSW